MVVRGCVRNGRIELDHQIALPEGAAVEVNVFGLESENADEASFPTLYEQLEPLIGSVKGLPTDLATNLDHYLYGLPTHK